MSTSDAVIERIRVREAAGVFRSRKALEAAAEALRLAGFDRADIDVLADADAVRQKLRAPYVAAEDLADEPRAPRRAFWRERTLRSRSQVSRASSSTSAPRSQHSPFFRRVAPGYGRPLSP